MPNILKIPASRYGNTGASQAVGPVLPNKGLLNPSPCAIDRAILPASPPNRQWSRYGSVRSGYRKDITMSRNRSATTTIQNKEREAFLTIFSSLVFRSVLVSEEATRSNRDLV